VRTLGSGSFGQVHLGLWRETKVAVKNLNLSQLTEDDITGFTHEGYLLSTLRHPNIVLFMGIDSNVSALCIVMEYCENGALYDRIHNRSEPYLWVQRLSHAADAARGVVFMHSLKPEPMIHRDLKSLNIFLDKHQVAKIGDLGLSRLRHNKAVAPPSDVEASRRTSSWLPKLKARTNSESSAQTPLLGSTATARTADSECNVSETGSMTALIGTPQWAAPEILQPAERETRVVYDETVDVYSFGIILFELCARQRPFEKTRFLTEIILIVSHGGRPTFPWWAPPNYVKLATPPRRLCPLTLHRRHGAGHRPQRTDHQWRKSSESWRCVVRCCDCDRE